MYLPASVLFLAANLHTLTSPLAIPCIDGVGTGGGDSDSDPDSDSGSLIDRLAKMTHGFVGADLEMLCMEAGVECIRRNVGWDRPGESEGGADAGAGGAVTSSPGEDGEDKTKGEKGKTTLLQQAFKNGKIPPNLPQEMLGGIKVTGEDFTHALTLVHPSSLRENNVEIPDVSWGSVGGLEEVKREVSETVFFFLIVFVCIYELLFPGNVLRQRLNSNSIPNPPPPPPPPPLFTERNSSAPRNRPIPGGVRL